MADTLKHALDRSTDKFLASSLLFRSLLPSQRLGRSHQSLCQIVSGFSRGAFFLEHTFLTNTGFSMLNRLEMLSRCQFEHQNEGSVGPRDSLLFCWEQPVQQWRSIPMVVQGGVTSPSVPQKCHLTTLLRHFGTSASDSHWH